MKNQIGKFFQRFRSNQRTRTQRLKNLRLESLEDRKLLAADVGGYVIEAPHQNPLIAEDVNQDNVVSPLDALQTINALNEGQGGTLEKVASGYWQGEAMMDVNGDGELSPVDALNVIRYLNGEGEGTPIARFSYEFVDQEGAPLSSNQVAVGDIFQLQAFIQDTRGFSAAGINAAYLDIDFDNNAAFDVAVGEIQSLRFFVDQLDTSRTDSSFTLSLDGQTTNPIPLFAGGAPQSNTAIAAAIQSELEALSNVGTGNVTAVVDAIATSEDQQNGIPRFSFEIRFGNDLAGQDLSLLTLDDSNVFVNVGQNFDFTITEVLAGNDSNADAEARAFVFDDLYNFARDVTVTDTAFDEVGASSQTIPLPTPGGIKPLFSVPLIARAPGVINFTPNEADLSPLHDVVTGVTVIPTMMVDYGAAFSLTVISDPTAPVAANDNISTNEDTPITLGANVLANDTVTAPRTLTLASVSATGTTQGTVNGTTYTPPANFAGTDVVTYIAQDSTGLQSNAATVTITVNPVNDAPVATDDTFTADEDSTGNVIDVLANDNGGPNEASDTITVTAVGATNNGGTATITAGGGSVTYSPAAGFIGTETFTYTITDAGGLEDTATVTVTVEPAVLPRARTDTPSTQENQAVEIDVLANDSANPGENTILVSLSSSLVAQFGSVQINDNGTPTDQTDDTITYTPNDENFNGVDTFAYVMNDTGGTGDNSIGTVTVTVTDVNDAPVLADDSVTATEDTTTTISATTLLSNDSPGPGEGPGSQNPQTLTITAVNATSAGGSVALSNGDVVYTPAANFNGTFTFTYTATDSGNPALSETATVTVTVTPVNDAPVAGDDTASTDEDNSLVIATTTLLANDSAGPADESGQTLSITGVSATSANGGTVSLAGGNVTYSPAADFNGSDTFTYTLSDGIASSTGTVTINVAPINDAPVPGADTASGFSDQSIVIQTADLLANDSPGPANESSQTLSIVSVAATSDTNGSVVLNSNGTITYTPTAGFSGTASFDYTVQDSGPTGGANVNQATGTVTVTVEAFSPSTVSGIVWVDETNDGVIDDAERQLGGVMVSIVGVSLGVQVPTQTQMTLSDGSYSFEGLGPGTYSVSFVKPNFLEDGLDVPGTLGDSDNVANQFSFTVPEPGGLAVSGYNFALHGLDRGHASKIDQLVSRYALRDPSVAYNGAYFGLGADNSLLWSSLLDGFDDVAFAEAVMTDNGQLLLTKVNGSGQVFTASLSRAEFIKTTDSSGNALVRVLGDEARFGWQQVDLSTPPFDAQRYLDSVEAIFAQEGW